MFRLLVINGGATHAESELESPGIGCRAPALALFSLGEVGRIDCVLDPNPHTFVQPFKKYIYMLSPGSCLVYFKMLQNKYLIF